jgi:hypothetical protein
VLLGGVDIDAGPGQLSTSFGWNGVRHDFGNVNAEGESRARDVRDRARRRRVALRVLIGESMTWLLLLACQSPIIEIDYLAVTALSPQNEAGDIASMPRCSSRSTSRSFPNRSTTTTVLLFANDGTPIAIDVLYAEADNTVIATPMDPLAYDAAYTFVISSDVEGAETGAMPADVLTRFRTGVPGPGPSNLVPIAGRGRRRDRSARVRRRPARRERQLRSGEQMARLPVARRVAPVGVERLRRGPRRREHDPPHRSPGRYDAASS